VLNPPGRTQNKKRRPTVRMPQFLRDELWPIRQDAGPVISFHGKPIKEVKAAWRKVRERAKLDAKVTTYSFRHTIGRFLRAEGCP
jgi:integrase